MLVFPSLSEEDFFLYKIAINSLLFPFIFSSLSDHFFFIFLIFVCSVYNNVYPKYCQSYKKMSINEFKDFIFENYYKRNGFPEKAFII